MSALSLSTPSLGGFTLLYSIPSHVYWRGVTCDVYPFEKFIGLNTDKSEWLNLLIVLEYCIAWNLATLFAALVPCQRGAISGTINTVLHYC